MSFSICLLEKVKKSVAILEKFKQIDRRFIVPEGLNQQNSYSSHKVDFILKL